MRRIHDGGTRTTRRKNTKHVGSRTVTPWGIAAHRNVREAQNRVRDAQTQAAERKVAQ